MNRVSIAAVALYAAAMLGSRNDVAAQEFSVGPSSIEFGRSAAVDARAAVVRNDTRQLQTYRVYWVDFDQTEDGTHRYFPFGEHPKSCKGRVELAGASILVGPGERGSFAVRMAPGATACWSIVFVEQALPPGRGLRLTPRIGIKVYGRGGQADSIGGRIDGLRVAGGGDERRLRVVVANTGDRILRGAGRVELYTEAGERVAEVPVSEFSVLSGYRRTVVADLPPGLGRGRYIAVAVLDYGGASRLGWRDLVDVR